MELEHDNTEETSLEDSLDITSPDDTSSDDIADTETESEPDAEAEETEGEESDETDSEGEETEETEGDEEKPDMSFKAGVYNKDTKQVESKDYTIDEKFAPLMKDPETAKAVKELHEKAFGLDAVKDRMNDTKQFASTVIQENQSIKTAIDGVKATYQKAVKSGNFLLMDDFFDQLKIPQDHVMTWAIQKQKLSQLPPEQQQLISAQMESEKRTEQLTQEQIQSQNQFREQAINMKRIMLDTVLSRPDVQTAEKIIKEKFGDQIDLRAEAAKFGQMAWYQSQGKVDLSPDEAIQQVLKHYGITDEAIKSTQALPAQQAAPTQQKKPVVQRTTQTIPNFQGSSSSPLKGKPKSIEDLKKLAKHYAEQG